MKIQKAKPSDRIHKVSTEIVDVMRKAELQPDEVVNIMLNILARSAIITCLSKQELLEAVGVAYDLHIADESNNETLN
jgi:PBP1b-binding outer membrane lipoprotein LpoB